MATAITYNDFRYGMVAEGMRRRADLQIYSKSASLIENMVPIRTGGVRLRPGLVEEADLTEIGAVRLVPFVISVREHYIIILSPKRLYIYGLGLSGAYENVSGEGFETQYTASEIPEVQHAHSYTKVVLVHRNHPPIVVERGSAGGWSVGPIVLDTSTDAYTYSYDDEGNEERTPLSYDYGGLFTLNNYPSVAAYHANRLWLGAPIEHPYRIWASKPFEDMNFQTEEYYNYLDESATTDQYMDAIAGAGETSEVLKQPVPAGTSPEVPGELWRVSKSVDAASGIVVSTNAIYEYFTDGTTGKILGHRVYDPDTDSWGDPVYDGSTWTYSFKYTRAVQKLDSDITSDSAMMLDMASDRDEEISWIASTGSSIFIGTASSEWNMPSSADALNPSIGKSSAYGSAPHLQPCYGVRNIFYVQSGRKLLRSVTVSGGGVSFTEPTYQCSDILSAGVREMAWQRVPEPRLHAVLSDGTMAVLCYDEDYGINAWCVWKSGYAFRSVAVIDDEEGQKVFALCEKDGKALMMRFSDGVFLDGDEGFTGRIVTNNLDSSDSMLFTKKTYRVAADSMGTEFRARVTGTSSYSSSYDYSKKLVKLWNWTRPSDEGIRCEFESVPGKDLILLAVILETEVQD